MRRMGIVAAATSMALLGLVGTSTTPALAAGVKAVRVAGGLNIPVGFTITPKGRLVYLEFETGWLRFRNLQTGFDRRVHRITNINSEGFERGALGVELHPAWPQQPFVYVFATRNTTNGPRNQLLRIKVQDGRGVAARLLLSISDGTNSTNHNGGRILFGPDGKLYVVVGDDGAPANAQDLTSNVHGKILRINPDGSIPADNLVGRIWAYGIRNSFGMAFDPLTGRLWETDNGPSCNDEINRIVRGGNFAWGPNQSCPDTNNSGPSPRIHPRHTFSQPVGITGVAFCDGCRLGAALRGDLFVGANNDGRIRRFDLNGTRRGFDAGPLLVLDHPDRVLSLEVAPNGRIFFSDFSGIYRLAPA